jgi:hypothetical protein
MDHSACCSTLLRHHERLNLIDFSLADNAEDSLPIPLPLALQFRDAFGQKGVYFGVVGGRRSIIPGLSLVPNNRRDRDRKSRATYDTGRSLRGSLPELRRLWNVSNRDLPVLV